ncbi:MAG: HDIG domain-containing metalloprotein, partial [Anaerolineae bacterium]
MTDLTAYARRWVALAGDVVAGVGYTAVEALHLAQRNRPKERFTLQFVEEPGGEPLALSPLLERVRPLLQGQDRPIYLVGGAVRDALLGRVSHDLDFVTPQRAIRLAFHMADSLGVPAYALDKNRDTGRVVLANEKTTLDFARFRGDSLTADLQDRDFTINAIALPATAQTTHSLIDPCGGAADLQAKLIRQTHAQAIANDPVRAWRALRLAAALGFELEVETAVAITNSAGLMASVSIERVRDELLKCLSTAVPHQPIQQAYQLNLLPTALPEICAMAGVAQSPPHHEPVFAHTLSVLRWMVEVETAVFTNAPLLHPALTAVRQALAPFAGDLNAHDQDEVDGGIANRMLRRLAALFHDVGKPETKSVEADGRIRFLGHDKVGSQIAGRRLRRLSLSNQAIEQVKRIVAAHMRPLLLVQAGHIPPSRRAIFRFFRAAGAAGLDVCLLALADHLATYDGAGDEGEWDKLVRLTAVLLRHYFQKREETVSPPPLVDGRALID